LDHLAHPEVEKRCQADSEAPCTALDGEDERRSCVLGSDELQTRLEMELGRALRRPMPGPKKSSKREPRIVTPEFSGK
jgi:hypothetical protein